eukprot:4425573-Prymnesium_polylepis.1
MIISKSVTVSTRESVNALPMSSPSGALTLMSSTGSSGTNMAKRGTAHHPWIATGEKKPWAVRTAYSIRAMEQSVNQAIEQSDNRAIGRDRACSEAAALRPRRRGRALSTRDSPPALGGRRLRADGSPLEAGVSASRGGGRGGKDGGGGGGGGGGSTDPLQLLLKAPLHCGHIVACAGGVVPNWRRRHEL